MKKLFILSVALMYMFNSSAQENMHIPGKKYQVWPHGVTYEIFVRSFADSNGDGIGDINGIAGKLGYLKDLGIEAIWLTPVSPSPTYHKYDVMDYYAIDKEYGTIDDFKNLVTEAHKLNIKIIPDIVVNHTSSQHPWFLEAMKGKDNPYRNFYIWKDSSELSEQRNWYLPHDENRKPIEGQKYYGFFSPGMPDLNYDNPKVREEVIKIGKYWLQQMGVDGFRLDAAQHIYDEKEVKKNVQWWNQFRSEMETVKKNVYLMGEVWNKDTVVAQYLHNALSGCFNFDLSFILQDVARSEQPKNLIDKVIHIRNLYRKYNPDFIDATILSNHDQNRIMDDLKGDMNQAGMAAALLLTLPGSPYLYYGEEIGMQGQKPDENIREPFLWDKGNRDKMQTKWMKAKYSTDKTVAPLSIQASDSSSMLNRYRFFLHERARNEFLRSGEIEKSNISNPNVCAFYRVWEKDSVLVIHNLSRKEVTFELPAKEQAYVDPLFTYSSKYVRTKNKIRLSPFSTIILVELEK